MKLILMTTPFFFVEEHQILTALFEEGLELLHLRKPGTEPFYSERLLSLIPEPYHRRIVVHDHFYLKNEYGLKGIHLNQRNPDLPENYRGHISCTCYSAEEVAARKKMMDYLFVAPVFQENGEPSPQFRPDTLQEHFRSNLFDKKVFAQGNITLSHIPALRDMGFAGAVVIGDIWNRFNIYTQQDFKDLLSHFRKLKKAAD